MRRPTRLLAFVLACACSATVTRGQSPTAPPKPGPEVKKLAVFVSKFRMEFEIKAGAMGPNSPAMKVSGIRNCRWTAGGFGVVCTETSYVGSTKGTSAILGYYDPTSKTYQFHLVDSSGNIDNLVGNPSGDTWTCPGESISGGKVYRTRIVIKFVSKDSSEYAADEGESESSMKPAWSGKLTRLAAIKPATSKPAQ
jgi:hypothetical protein